MIIIHFDRQQVPEALRSRGVARARQRVADRRCWRLSLAAVASCFAVGAALGNPVGPTVVSGQASFSQQGSQLSISNSTNAVIHWQGFSIGPAEITRFLQPSASSAVLNRVTAGVPSDILGMLQSNGRVFLINPSGIVFGAGARIDVAGLVASTLNITNADFLAGRLRFGDTPGAGSIVNQGAIRTAPRGNVYLIAPAVENSGVITSPRGEVILAAGRSVELVDAGTPDLRVQIKAPDNLAVNLGSIVARSGRIGIHAGLIQQKGVVNADTAVVGENGRIQFQAKDITLAPGSVTTASGAAGGAHDGGEVRIVAEGTVDMQAGAEVHADGGADGGDGGFLELSGKQKLVLNRNYSVRARKEGFRGGTLLFDPVNVEFCDNGACVTGADLQVAPADINTAGASLVEFLADNDITVTSALSAVDLRGAAGGGAGTELALTAGNNAAISANILFGPDQRFSVEAGNNVVTGSNATVRAGRVDFEAINGGITIGAGTTVVADNPGSAFVSMLAGTVTGANFSSTPANRVDILGTVRASGGSSSLVAIGGAQVTVAASGIVEAATASESPATATQAAVVMSAMSSATGGFGQPGIVFPAQTDHGVANSVHISGRVAASDPNIAGVRILGGTVTVDRGPQTGPNIEATGGLRGDILAAALTRASNFDPGGFPGSTVSATDRAVNVAGWIRSTAAGSAEVELLGGTVSLGAGSRLDAIGASAILEAAAAGTTREAGGPGAIVNFASFVPENRLRVEAGATLNAGTQEAPAGVAEVNLIGGSVDVAGDVRAFGQGNASVAFAAASGFNEVRPVQGAGGRVRMTHGAGHDVTVSGRVQADAAGGNAQVMLVGDRVGVTGGSEADPNVEVTGSGAFGGVLAVAASSSEFSGSDSLTASTHSDTNVVDVSGWVQGAANDIAVDVVGGKVNVRSSGGVQAEGGASGEVILLAAGSLTSPAPSTFQATMAPTNGVDVAGTVRAQGSSNAKVWVLGGSIGVQPATGNVLASGTGFSTVAMLAARNANFLQGSLILNSFAADPANTVTANGSIVANGNASAVVGIQGGTVRVPGTVSATGNNSATVDIRAALDCDGSGLCAFQRGPLTSAATLFGTVSATAGGGVARTTIRGFAVEQTEGTVRADGASLATVDIAAATTCSENIACTFAPGNTVSLGSVVEATDGGPSGRASVILGGQSVAVLAGGEVEATAPGGELVQGVASGDITIGGNIYGGGPTGGVTLDAGGAIIGAGGTIDANVGDTISLTAGTGIGAVGAPVRILDGEPIVTANTVGGDIAIAQVNGDMIVGAGPGTAGRGFFSLVSTANGSIDLSAPGGGITVNRSLSSPVDLFLAASGPVTVQTADGFTSVSAARNLTVKTSGALVVQGTVVPGADTLVTVADLFAGQDMKINAESLLLQNAGVMEASRNLAVEVPGDITVRDGALVAFAELEISTLGNLTVEESTLQTIVGADFVSGSVGGDVVIRATRANPVPFNLINVPGAAEVVAFTDIGSQAVPFSIGGALRIDGIPGGEARMEAGAPGSIHLFFPRRGSGGFFVNGVEGRISDGGSGLFVNGLPAVLDSNLRLTYGGARERVAGEVEVVRSVVAPLTGYVNQATELAVPSGEQGATPISDPGEKDDQRKRPAVCS